LEKINFKKYSPVLFILFLFVFGCNYVTYKTITKEQVEGGDDLEPNYDVTLDRNFQDFVTYMYMGNRSEEFGTFFNKLYSSLVDFDDAMTDYRTSTITAYNRKLDSLNITPLASATAKGKFDSVITRCSKIIQYHKSTRFLDDAVLLIGKSYYYMGEYLQAERKFNEFLSKLTKSDLYDEAILYLGMTKLKLGKSQEAETILLNLFKYTNNSEIKSDITQDLALLSLSRNDYKGAIENFEKSMEFTKDKEKKAEKQYILAKIYSQYKPEEAYIEYRKSFALTSDFDLLFYSKLNEAKSLNVIGKNKEAFEILDRLSGKYRDYPDFKQLVELEIANTTYYEKKYSEAKKKYYNIILEYPGSKSAADAYYYLANYSEYIKNDYLFAYVNYKKVTETSTSSDYSTLSSKRTVALDKYFSFLAIIRDTAKITYPDNEPEFIKYKKLWGKEKGVEGKDKENPKGNESNPPNPKGGGCKSFGYIDSLDNTDTTKLITDTSTIKQNVISDTTGLNKVIDTTKIKNVIDTIGMKNLVDTTNNKVEIKKLSPEDSLLLAIHIEDSVKAVKKLLKIDAYFQISELFLYEFNRADSAIYYLNLIVVDSTSSEKSAKALYTIATIYKNQGNDSLANDIYRKTILKYPETLFANESRKILGLQVIEIVVDSVELLYKSAEKNVLSNNYESALIDLTKILNNYPNSRDSIYAKTLYSIGWIYEYSYKNKDSSLTYYKKLKTDFPTSKYALSVNPKIDFYTSYDNRDTTKKAVDTTGVLFDSLNPLDSTKIKQEKNKEGEYKEKPDKNKEKLPEKNKNEKKGGEVPNMNKPPEKKK
jgi:TolA-binding protein